MMNKDDSDLLSAFVEEAQEHLQLIEPDLLELEQGGAKSDPEVVNRVFRSVHSIKGSSGFFGLEKIGRLSHVMENLLSKLRSGKLSVTPEFIDALLAGIDTLRVMVEDVANSEEIEIENDLRNLKSLSSDFAEEADKKEADKKEVEADGGNDSDAEIARKLELFDIPTEVFDRISASSNFLYLMRINVKKDILEKDRTIEDYLEAVGKLGDVVAKVEDESDGSDGQQLLFLFNTVMETDLAVIGLEVDRSQVEQINLSAEGIKPPKDVEPQELDVVEEKTESSGDVMKKKGEAVGESTDIPETDVDEIVPTCEALPENIPEEESDTPDDDTVTESAQDTTAKKPKIQTDEKLRVSVSLLNDLVNLAGELVLDRNQLLRITEALAKDAPGLSTVLKSTSQVTTEMQEKIMQLRMQPVSVLFGKYNRIVRDMSRKQKKAIVLETSGEDVELDKSIIEALIDPMTHLVRNAVDHAIELPEEREKAGKPRQGKILLKAYQEGGQVHLAIVDNGCGMDADKIAKTAVEKNLVTSAQIAGMNVREKVRLILKPGFSTAKEVTAVSGRGVGMNVVNTNIEELGGTVEIETTVGEGTKIDLNLPLTLAIVSGLVVGTKGHNIVVPEANIQELVRVRVGETDNTRVEQVQKVQMLRLRDSLIPLIRLDSALGIISEKEERAEIKKQRKGDVMTLRFLIVSHGNSRFALQVDEVVSTEEIVVKPLPRFIQKLQGVSGTTIMGDGSVSLILDVAGVVQVTGMKRLEEKIVLEEEADTELLGEKQSLLIFDIGSEERFALPLQLINRVEQIPISEIERVEQQDYLQYRDANLRLIYIDDFLPVSKPDRSEWTQISLIVPKSSQYPMALVIRRVIDTIETVIDLDTRTITGKGLYGFTVLDGKITMLPDMFKVFEMADPNSKEKAEYISRNGVKAKILLVEDTPFFRTVEKDYFESAGHEVILAEDGEKALNILAREQFDIVVSDILMPNLDGFGLVKALRSDDRWKDLPVLALTSMEDAALAQRCMKDGFTDWEIKLNKEKLLTKLDAILAGDKTVA